MSAGVHLDKAGTVRPQSPKAIQALGQARESMARIIVGATILIILTVAYVVAIFMKLESAAVAILPVVSTGLGFILGRSGKPQPEE